MRRSFVVRKTLDGLFLSTAILLGALPFTLSGAPHNGAWKGLSGLRFEPNRGHLAPGIAAAARGAGYSVTLSSDRASLLVRKPSPANSEELGTKRLSSVPLEQVEMSLRGARTGVQPVFSGLQSGVSNYFLGNDPGRWQTGIPNYHRVRFAGVYPGIDLVYYGSDGRLEYDFVVQPGADPRAIRLQFDHRVTLSESGDLIVGGGVLQRCPVAYQEVAGGRRSVEAAYRLAGNGEISLALGDYDREQPLILDPVIVYSTYLGGPNNDHGYSAATDSAGALYLAGDSGGSIANVGPVAAYAGGSSDVMVAKLSASGSVVYFTYIGGSADEAGLAIAVDASGNAYVTGSTTSANFPVLNAAEPTYGGARDMFALKLNPSGAILYSTFLGGPNADDGLGIAVDPSGFAIVVGQTTANTFPILNAFQPTFGGGASDGVVVKLSPTGAAVFSSFFGGAGDDRASGVSTDSTGNIYICGSTTSSNLPVKNALQATLGGAGVQNGFILQLASGGQVNSATYFGGNSNSSLLGVSVDPYGSAVYVGTSQSGWPVFHAVQGTFGGASDAVVLKISSSGTLLYSTYLGGSGSDTAWVVSTDPTGAAYVGGQTACVVATGSSTCTGSFPVVNALQSTYGGGPDDGFVARITPYGAISYATYLGGTGDEVVFGIGADPTGAVVVAGSTNGGFPVLSAGQPTYAGGLFDAFAARISPFAPIATSRITGLGPASAVVNTGAFTLAVAGTGFQSGATVYWNSTPLATTVNSSSSLSAAVPATLLTAIDFALISVTNPGETSSNAVPFSIVSTVLTPVASAGSVDYAFNSSTGVLTSRFVTVTASNVQANSVINWGGAALTTTATAGGASGALTSTQVQTPGAVLVNVTNPGGTASNSLTIIVPSARSVTGISPTSASAGGSAFTLTVTGTGFVSGDQIVVQPGGTSGYLTTQFVNSTTLQATVPASLIAAYGTVQVFVNYTGSGAGAGTARYATNQTALPVTSTATLALNRSALNFGRRPNGTVTVPQTVRVTTATGIAWTATSNQPNITVTPGSGSGSGNFTVTVTGASANGTITVSAPSTTNSPQTVSVAINNLAAAGSGTNPSNTFGVIDQPGASQTTGFSGAIPVTGWALDDVSVSKVSLYREPVSQDNPASIVTVVGKQLVPIGDAIFLPDTRPDVAGTYPSSPLNYRGGWGLLFLTNTTLNNNGTPGYGGNGTYVLHVIATSQENFQFELGSRTITIDNVHATLPFGTIDTPTQGEQNDTGTQYVNFAWALTPQPKMIATDASTIFVSIDGAFSGRPSYGYPRSDIDSLFPNYTNTGKAVGFFYIDMTRLANGIHSIAWSVRDNGGALQGIGSRVFYVNNPGGPVTQEPAPTMGTLKRRLAVEEAAAVTMRRGPDFDAPLARLDPSDEGYVITVAPSERLELHTGVPLADVAAQTLPPCSTVDGEAGVFFWQPPVMALGDFPVALKTASGGTFNVLVRIRVPESWR